MRHVVVTVLVGLTAVAVACGTAQIDRPQLHNREHGVVTRVVDGDTIRVQIGDRNESVRLLGIDTPETDECYADKATDWLVDAIQGRKVVMRSDDSQGDRDRYDRLLRQVARASDGFWLNLALVQDGYAREYTYDKPYAFADQFKRAERRARAQDKGLWGACAQ
jgi:micrococcal nuclease